MINAGIEAMNLYGGSAYIDVSELAIHRNLDMQRFENLLLKKKSVALLFEDPITLGVNAAKPIIDSLSEEEKNKIELLITCTESGVDFSKSISSYMHKYLNLNNNCRIFELKQACFSGTAGYQMALNFILANTSPGAKALVIATDVSRFTMVEGKDVSTEQWAFAEPSGGAGAVALLVSNKPYVFKSDIGANGSYSFNVMDTFRPNIDGEAGDAELSLLSYLDCCEKAYANYESKVDGVNYKDTFDYLSFHAPFGGMVKGAHRTMMRKKLRAKSKEIEEDFKLRVEPGLLYCQQVGNIMGATIFMFLAGIIDSENLDKNKRVGCFSYGSGCCSEFYSGVISSKGKEKQKSFNIQEALDNRYKLNMDEYDKVLIESSKVLFGTRNLKLDLSKLSEIYRASDNRKKLVLEEIKEYERIYGWY